MRFFLRILLLNILLFSCKKKPVSPVVYTDPFSIVGNKIFHFNNPVQLIGVNAFHSFGAGGSDMNSWQIDIVREFTGNMKQQPLSGSPILDANGAYLHSLQAVADSNRAGNRITILCPFGWDGTASTEFTGKMPALTPWWIEFKVRLQQWAVQFKSQPDVWIELWNEPYRFDRTDGYSDNIWMNDMNELAAVIRNAGNNNIILVPVAEQGQDEAVLVSRGAGFLAGKKNILFDIHAYEKWLLDDALQLNSRLQHLQQLDLPVIFGETAPVNAGTLMDPALFTDAVFNNGFSVCAWVWKYDGTDQDALLNAQGNPNNNNNNNWGTLFKNTCKKPRNP